MVERLVALASIAVRHAGAYTDLILSDIDASRSALRRRLLTATIMVSSSVLAAGMACVGVIALTWDTPARIWAIAGLLTVFLAIAIACSRKLSALRASDPALLSQAAREWAKDRELLEELLARERAETS
jgi:uncharacterized membrane protein YqjE